MFKNVSYIDLIDRHEGNEPCVGGQRKYYRRLWPLGNDKWEVEYRVSPDTAGFCAVHGEICSLCGGRWECRSCPDFNYVESRCAGEYQTMTTEEIQALAHKYPSCAQENPDGHIGGIIDCTGHAYTPCSHGGCTICYPCGHKKCETNGLPGAQSRQKEE